MAALRLLLVAALFALPFWVARSAPAHACTYGGSLAIRSADVIAVGTIGEMLILPPESVAHPDELGGRAPVEIKFAVSEYVRGRGPSTLLIYRPAAQMLTDAATGAITAIQDSNTTCAFGVHTGDQIVALLTTNDPLRYQLSLGSTIITDEKSKSDALATIREVLSGASALPITGSGPTHHGGPPIAALAAASALAAFGLAANAAFALRRRS